VIELLVEHFFTVEGQQRFPAWIHEIGSRASRYRGFIDIRQLTKRDEPDRCVFRLSFQTPEDAQGWITSPDRKEVLALMAPHRLDEHRATHWLAGESWAAST
jgi:antibiotic biosynthesis monooxygenase (ABM) superfamily enzyme